MHPATAAILPYFDYAHLPEPQQAISRRCHDVAIVMSAELDGPEVTAGLRKLLEAKDCFVRASLGTPRATRYHVLICDELVPKLERDRMPAGFRLVEQEPTDPGRYPGMHWWLVEDDDADPEIEGKRVEITVTRGRVSEAETEDRTRITERRVLA
jgi:hypothetical protein